MRRPIWWYVVALALYTWTLAPLPPVWDEQLVPAGRVRQAPTRAAAESDGCDDERVGNTSGRCNGERDGGDGVRLPCGNAGKSAVELPRANTPRCGGDEQRAWAIHTGRWTSGSCGPC
jgi:hypothetical protein